MSRIMSWIKGLFRRKKNGPVPFISFDEINEITNEYWVKGLADILEPPVFRLESIVSDFEWSSPCCPCCECGLPGIKADDGKTYCMKHLPAKQIVNKMPDDPVTPIDIIPNLEE